MKLDGAGWPLVACGFSLLVLDISWFMGSTTEQGSIIPLIGFGLHFVIFISWIICCGVFGFVFISEQSDLWDFFQLWLGNLTDSPSENVVTFPAFCPDFYGVVGMKPFGKNRYPNLLCHILSLLWFLSLPRHCGCQLWDLFHCFTYISSFSCTCVGAQQVPGSVYPILAVSLCLRRSTGSHSSLVFWSFIYMSILASHVLTWQIVI